MRKETKIERSSRRRREKRVDRHTYPCRKCRGRVYKVSYHGGTLHCPHCGCLALP